MTLQRTDLEVVLKRKPNLQMVEFTWLISTLGVPNLDADPFKDIRVRRAFHMAVNGKDVIQVNPFGYGHGSPNPLVPAALKDWSIPIDQLPAGGTPPLSARPGGSQAAARPGGCQQPEIAGGVDEQLGPGVLGRRAGDHRAVEEVRASTRS